MRHRVLKYKLNRTSSHRKALLNNMTLALIKHEQINTTLVKAKNLRPFVEKIITLAKKNNLASRKKAFSILKNKKIIDKLFTNIAKRYEARKGGYIRILKNGFRYGDMAPLAVIELVDRDKKAKGLDSSASISSVDTNAQLLRAAPPLSQIKGVPIIHKPLPGGVHLNSNKRCAASSANLCARFSSHVI